MTRAAMGNGGGPMDEETKSFFIGVALFGLLCGSLYGSYKLGRWQERRSYQPFLVQAFQASYLEGFDDGRKFEVKSWQQTQQN